MSDTSQGDGWWQASDGKWYPPHLHPDYRVPAPPPTSAPQTPPAPTTATPPTQPAPATPVSGPAVAFAKSIGTTTWVMLGGGLLVVLGSFTTWVTASVGLFSVSENGTSGDGKFTLILAILAIGAALANHQVPRQEFSIATVVLFGLLTILSIYEFVHISSKSYSGDGITISATVGVGVYLCIAGSVAGVVAWIIEKRRSFQVMNGQPGSL
jgi:hypothetical protein